MAHIGRKYIPQQYKSYWEGRFKHMLRICVANPALWNWLNDIQHR